ncbi:MAG: hypothetical protein PF440_12165 [Thiomicrorhabdus sp.]|jgi:hypothetical protein|nr:hypothetical protein [Thiomicrorhabdus sp.]
MKEIAISMVASSCILGAAIIGSGPGLMILLAIAGVFSGILISMISN